MKKRGFTLIELLAVIVILAVIAVIAVPTVMNIIANAQKSAFKDSIYGIIKAGEMYYTNKMMDADGITEDKTFTFPDAIGLEIKGSKPQSGTMVVTKEGKVGLAVSNGKYCVKKGVINEDMTIEGDLENCKIPSILASTNLCIKDTKTICPNGTKVEVKVNNNDSYHFYIIKDTKEELTLILDKNIENNVEWISEIDYVAAGGNTVDYGSDGNNNKGPITALKVIENKTSGWTNIPLKTYTLIDDGGKNNYNSITRTNVRARMLTNTEAQEIKNLNSGILPNYLYNSSTSNNEAYWLSSAYPDDSSNAISMIPLGVIGKYLVNNNIGSYGVRPVITLSKNI